MQPIESGILEISNPMLVKRFSTFKNHKANLVLAFSCLQFGHYCPINRGYFSILMASILWLLLLQLSPCQPMISKPGLSI